MSGKSVILGIGGWIEEDWMGEEPANDTEDSVEIDDVMMLVDGNTLATPVGCIESVIAPELLGPCGERVPMRDELRV